MFIDTEGFFQPNGSNENNMLQEFLLNHIEEYCDILIFVLEKTVIYEIKLLNRIIQSYSKSRIRQMFIVHNLKFINEVKKIEEEIERNVRFSFEYFIYKSDQFCHQQLVENSQKIIYHFYLGDNNSISCKQLNRKTIRLIQEKIKNSPEYIKIDSSNKLKTYHDSIMIAIRKTLFKYYNNINENIKINLMPVQIENGCKYIFYIDGEKNQSITPRSNDYMSSIWKTNYLDCKFYEEFNYAYLFIECAGLVPESLIIEVNESYEREVTISIVKKEYILDFLREADNLVREEMRVEKKRKKNKRGKRKTNYRKRTTNSYS